MRWSAIDKLRLVCTFKIVKKNKEDKGKEGLVANEAVRDEIHSK